jgi:hypothetical protein
VSVTVAVAVVAFVNATLAVPVVEIVHKYVTTEEPPDGTQLYELVCEYVLDDGATVCVMMEDSAG